MEFDVYLKDAQRELGTGDPREHAYRPALKTLLESLEPGLQATNELRRSKGVPLGYVEAKDLGRTCEKSSVRSS